MSFLKKFKKNIGVEETENTETKEESEEETEKKRKKIKVNPQKPAKKANKKETTEEKEIKKKEEVNWLEQRGELTVDVYKTKEDLVVQSVVAGIKPEDLDIVIENGILTIQGERKKPEDDSEEEKSYFLQECYWGPFQKRIVLQEEIDNSKVEASMKEGIITIIMPRVSKTRKRKIVIKT